tara:strand:- start:1086 stop:2180 length:1095 start_codon:yes stop_codon:yes gene_type:complete
MGLEVLGPCVNESFYKFTVNDHNAVRFGMGAVKGVGSGAVATIVAHREEDGKYKSVFDLAKRVDLRSANKKAFENLALAGGFDTFEGTHRAQYLYDTGDGQMFIEKVLKYAAKYQESQNSSQVSLFGESSDVQIPEPVVPPCDDWGTMQKLSQERDVVGVFISGHPLDDFKNEIKYFCNASLAHLKNLEPLVNREVSFAGIVTGVEHRVSKNGKGWAMFTIEDYKDAYEFRIFGEEYLKQRHFLIVNSFVYVKLFVKQGWVNKETGKRSDPRIQFNSFEQLQDVMDKQSKKLSIQLNVADLTNDKVLALKETIRNNKGEKQLSFIVYEMEEKIKVTMISRTEKVNITNEFLDLLKKQNYKYKMN